MGAWGYKGYDNDSAMDWVDGICEMLQFTLNHAYWSQYVEEGIAAAQLLSDLPEPIKEKLGPYAFNEALEAVAKQLKPENYKQYFKPALRLRYLKSLEKRLSHARDKFPKPGRRRLFKSP